MDKQHKRKPQGNDCGFFGENCNKKWSVRGALKAKKRKKRVSGAIAAAVGFLCAAVLGALFYGAMVYQAPDVPESGMAADVQEEGGVLALEGGQLLSEQTVEAGYGGQTCTALVRTYRMEDGAQAEAITASPCAYLERLTQEGWTPQLITGFTLAGLDAVYALRGDECLLAARQGDTVYMIRAGADEQAAYALGAGACLE